MTLLEQRITGLHDDLSTIISELVEEVKPKTVHRLRTTIRRIESLISYVNPDLGKKLDRSLEKLADLRKRAGKVRDLDVQIGLLDGIANTSTVKDRSALAALLAKKRNRQAERLSAGLKKLQESKFLVRIRRVADKVAAGPAEENRPLAPLEEARAQLARMAVDFASRAAIKTSRLHDARLEVKRIRYLAELADESDEQKGFVGQLKSVQDALGEWHDWQELANAAEKRFADRVNCALLREIRALLAARHLTATSAVSRLLELSFPAEKKKLPHSVPRIRTLAQHA